MYMYGGLYVVVVRGLGSGSPPRRPTPDSCYPAPEGYPTQDNRPPRLHRPEHAMVRLPAGGLPMKPQPPKGLPTGCDPHGPATVRTYSAPVHRDHLWEEMSITEPPNPNDSYPGEPRIPVERTGAAETRPPHVPTCDPAAKCARARLTPSRSIPTIGVDRRGTAVASVEPRT